MTVNRKNVIKFIESPKEILLGSHGERVSLWSYEPAFRVRIPMRVRKD